MRVDMTFDERQIGQLLVICASSTDPMAVLYFKQFKDAAALQARHDHAAWLAREADQRAKAERALSATLTFKQAQCLASRRAGKSLHNEWQDWRDPPGWGIARASSMGGAIARMLRSMQAEGLLDDSRKPTNAGLKRLARWEETHKHPWLYATRDEAKREEAK